jgi:hypothetical protein
MAFLRRRGPEPGTEFAPAASQQVTIASVGEECPFCEGEIVVDADNPSELLVAILLDQPGYPQHLVAHRACAENAAGRRLL